MLDSSYSTLAWYGARRRRSEPCRSLKLKTRLELSKAKHRSLVGHSRMSRRIAALIPFYEYDERRFFRADDPPEEIAARRRAAFARLSELLPDALRGNDPAAPPRRPTASPTCSSPSATACRSSSAAWSASICGRGPSCKASSGVTVTDLDGNTFYDLTGSYGVNVFGYDFYKDCIAARRGTRARPRPGARRLSSGGGRQCPPAARRFPASTKCRSTCPAPKR